MGVVIDIALFRRAVPAWRRMVAGDATDVAGLAARLGQPRPARPVRREDGPDIVLRKGDALAGYAFCRTETRSGILVVVIDDLVIRPDMRERGHGGEAVASFLAWAAQRGARAMAAVARDGSDGFWSRQGFHPTPGGGPAPRGMVMARAVPTRGNPLLTTSSQV